MKKALKRFFLCRVLKLHEWTCAAEQKIPPTEEQLHGGIQGFWSYATTYCKRCGVVSEYSKERLK